MNTEEQILQRVNDVFHDVFDDQTITVARETTADDVADWDSLIHIELILAMEEEFGLKFAMSEVTGMKNVGEMIGIIMNRATK